MVKVALGTVILPDDHSVYKFFPGKGYKFYEVQRAIKLAFLDIRGLDTLGDDPLAWTDKQMLSVITNDRYQRLIDEGNTAPKSRRTSQGDKQSLTFLRGLISAKQGDLVVVPGSGFRSEVLIGQITEEPGKLRMTRVKERHGTHVYMGRRVEWVATLPKRLFDLEIINLLQSRAAFFDIGRSHYEDIHRIAFDSYVYDGQFVGAFSTSKSIFTSKDNLLTSVWFELMDVLAEAHTDGKELTVDSIYEVVIESASTGLTYAQAMTAEIEAQTTSAIDRQCMGQVDESVKEYLRILGAARWEEACKVAMRATTQSTLATRARLTN